MWGYLYAQPKYRATLRCIQQGSMVYMLPLGGFSLEERTPKLLQYTEQVVVQI